jgi:uncharacterized protein
LPGGGTYHTRPMSEAPSQRLDVERLAEARAEIQFAISLAEFPRLRPYLASTESTARGRVRFERDRGLSTAEVELDGTVDLVCQRCLQTMQQVVSSRAQVALISSEGEADRVPQEYEPVLAAEGRITLHELVEEELLLSLPIVPLHQEGTTCADEAESESDAEASKAGETQRPFEQLGELLKRKR